MLGVIPSLVKTWRATDCMRGLDWSRIRRFSSTGECSNPDDMLYLMSLAGYKPVIEYCGGTELGGGYIGSTMAQPNVPADVLHAVVWHRSWCWSMKRRGRSRRARCSWFRRPSACRRSCCTTTITPSISTKRPRDRKAKCLRRHGDAMERLAGRILSRAGTRRRHDEPGGHQGQLGRDRARAEPACPAVRETAAVAVAPPGGGPSMLWIFAVLAAKHGEVEPASCKANCNTRFAGT